MTDNEHDALAERIKAARRVHSPEADITQKQAESTVNAGGMALRYGAEFGASVFVGLLLGLGIDKFLGTAPWGLLIMLGFGLAAGILGVIRAYKQINAEYAILGDSDDE